MIFKYQAFCTCREIGIFVWKLLSDIRN